MFAAMAIGRALLGTFGQVARLNIPDGETP
jgi:hypothetical protein